MFRLSLLSSSLPRYKRTNFSKWKDPLITFSAPLSLINFSSFKKCFRRRIARLIEPFEAPCSSLFSQSSRKLWQFPSNVISTTRPFVAAQLTTRSIVGIQAESLFGEGETPPVYKKNEFWPHSEIWHAHRGAHLSLSLKSSAFTCLNLLLKKRYKKAFSFFSFYYK